MHKWLHCIINTQSNISKYRLNTSTSPIKTSTPQSSKEIKSYPSWKHENCPEEVFSLFEHSTLIVGVLCDRRLSSPLHSEMQFPVCRLQDETDHL